jgi:hypothetical protein
VTGIIVLFFDERLELSFFVQGQEKERAWMWNLRVVHRIGIGIKCPIFMVAHGGI